MLPDWKKNLKKETEQLRKSPTVVQEHEYAQNDCRSFK
jgi:hypothetical protein